MVLWSSLLHSVEASELQKHLLKNIETYFYTISEEGGGTPKEENSMLLFKHVFKTPKAFAIRMASMWS